MFRRVCIDEIQQFSRKQSRFHCRIELTPARARKARELAAGGRRGSAAGRRLDEGPRGRAPFASESESVLSWPSVANSTALRRLGRDSQ